MRRGAANRIVLVVLLYAEAGGQKFPYTSSYSFLHQPLIRKVPHTSPISASSGLLRVWNYGFCKTPWDFYFWGTLFLYQCEEKHLFIPHLPSTILLKADQQLIRTSRLISAASSQLWSKLSGTCRTKLQLEEENWVMRAVFAVPVPSESISMTSSALKLSSSVSWAS